ncbi:MAG TPA: alpha/beta fold hydrolase [Kofleriaceae bacterium]|nr:alpha/beta fold hydrolase [Kofleriaceae bacterium]
MEAGLTTPWIVRPRPNPGAALRLLCVPYAGGGASVFRRWPDGLPADVELLAIEPPGRETRLRERPFDQLGPLVEALADAVAPRVRPPFAVYGHSLGALVAFGLARELRRRSLGEPVHLFVSGRRAPQLPELSPSYHLPDPALVDRLRRLGGIPDALFQEPDLLAFFLPILRADLAVTETAVIPVDDPLACPITALGGLSDERASVAELEAWRAWTRGAFDREMFPGGHFFLQTERTAVLDALSRRLARIAAAP